ncbi:protein vestigial isoform X1 [Lucilia sericata]|uniref:protein vestigial isoform X1 n=1 Tax=Lucilia sericata TaxID=13632 RepID=UPI0018A8730A|nr:protein vestigial isoform X1 [Lucilia sericata]XP_037827880.1 protein vestigial isoform X1 [Lucilia sericata]XP_037827882.1 protein vestigial isoform X1 [Lucilia sericata]XP_037827883.1 protein vestigial isoform X1 [Lucilia sericata]
MAVSCPEVMYGAYYPYLYGRAGPSRSFYQYERFNQDLYSSSGVQLASSSASGSSHSPCSPILPPSVSANAAAAAVAAAHNTAAAVVAAAAQTANQASSSSSLSANLPLSAGSSGSSGGAGGGGGGGGVVVGSNVTGAIHGSAGASLMGSSIGNTLHSRTHTKEEDLGAVPRNDAEARLVGAHHHNESSCSSGPDSPRHHSMHQGGGAQAKELPLDTTSINAGQGRAQYLSATCVVFTNYSGDTASVVDEHFSRALNFNNKESKESTTPMSTRNFPPSFWNSNYVHPVTATTHPQMSDLYSSDGGYATDPWVPHAAAHYGTYAHAAHAHAAHAHAYHHNMAQYGSLLRLPQQYGHSSRLHHDQQTAHALESAAAYSSYPTMAGLEAQVQESSKDLYWF